MPGFQRGRAGRDAYMKAQGGARAATPADPQTAAGGEAFPELNAPCGTCGHANCLHDIGTRKGRPVVTWCTVMTAAGACGCQSYTPGDMGN